MSPSAPKRTTFSLAARDSATAFPPVLDPRWAWSGLALTAELQITLGD